jgi:DNA-binding response OmpR family regulator
MLARVVIALSDPDLTRQTAEELAAAGYDVAACPDSMAALNILDDAAPIALLLTSVLHQSGLPNGIALARMARLKRRAIKVLFVGNSDEARYTTGLGLLLSPALTASQLVTVAVQTLQAGPEPDGG